MRIPSYDDLTPSIPDISTRDTHAQVGRILPADARATATPAGGDARRAAEASSSPGAPLFACLRSTRAAEAIVAIARDFSPRLERHGPACVVLDVSGLGRLLGDAHAIGAELDRAAADRAAVDRAAVDRAEGIRVAVAPTQTAAQLLALAQPGLTVTTGNVAAALALLPLDTLRAFMEEAESGAAGGVHPSAQTPRAGGPAMHPSAQTPRAGGPAMQVAARMKATAGRLDTFRRWGLTTLGDIAALPAADLSERMGQDGLVLQRLAQGVDLAPLIPDPGVPRFLQSIELEWPIDTLEPLSFVLARLLDPLSAALERADRGAAALRLDLRLVDRTMHARVLQLPAAMRDAKVLRTLLLLDLESHPPPAGIDIVTVEIDPAPARIIQYSLLERAMPSAETLATLTARLGALVGESRCGSAALLDTYRPDGFEMRRFAPEASRAGVQSRTLRDPPQPAPASFRLTSLRQDYGGPPERSARRRKAEATDLLLEAITDPLHAAQGVSRTHAPAQPRDGLILRRFRMPIAIRVTVERGRPVRVAIDRRGMPGGHVEQQAGPWRTSGAWWDPAGAAWDRDEWDVALSDGSLCRLFRDRLTEKWFLEGVLD